jgi:hypothetical protein
MLGACGADGDCSSPTARLVVTKRSSAEALPIVYDPNDEVAGCGAIHWAGGGNVDNLLYDAEHDRIIYNGQGYHMAGAVVYMRCPQ